MHTFTVSIINWCCWAGYFHMGFCFHHQNCMEKYCIVLYGLFGDKSGSCHCWLDPIPDRHQPNTLSIQQPDKYAGHRYCIEWEWRFKNDVICIYCGRMVWFNCDLRHRPITTVSKQRTTENRQRIPYQTGSNAIMIEFGMHSCNYSMACLLWNDKYLIESYYFC